MPIPVCLSTTGKYHSIVCSSPASSSITGCSACDSLRTFSIAPCAISRTPSKSTRSSDPGLQRQAYLLARFFFLFFAALRQREGAINRVPELRERAFEILLLVRRPALWRNLLLALEGVVQIAAHALKLRLPRGQRIGLLVIHKSGVEHVTHRDADGIQLILNAQQLQRVFPVSVNQIT